MQFTDEELDLIRDVLFEWKVDAKKRLKNESDFVQNLCLQDQINDVEEILETYFDND